MNNTYVYLHRRLDNNQVFYVGIGSKYRAYNSKQRTLFWKRIVNKYGYKVELLYDKLNFKDAIKIEIELIAKYGRRDLGTGYLCNMTDGGEGTLGRIISENHRKILKNSNIGKKANKETIEKLRTSHLGLVLTKESIDKRTLTMIDSDKYKKGTSKYKGVSWCKKKLKWRATIHMNNKCQHLGYFDEEDDAYNKYKEVLDIKKNNLIEILK